MATCQELYDDAVSQFEQVRLLAKCKLTETDATDVISNLTSSVADMEIIVDNIEARLEKLIALAVSLREQVNGL